MRRPIRFASILLLGLFAPTAAFAQPSPAPEKPSQSEEPPKATEAPLVPALPQATTETPTSTSGTELRASDSDDKETDARQDVRIRNLERRQAHDERRIMELESRVKLFKNLRLEAFIQPQLLVQTFNSAASPNVLPDGTLPTGIDANDTVARPDGTTSNGTFFRVRRARMRTFYETQEMRLFLQIDALPAGGVGPGIGTILRNAEATGIARWTRNVRSEFTAGLFFTPFRAELLEASVVRPFIERTWFIQNVFPIERDYGAHVKTIALDDKLVVDLAIVNGQRLGERTFVALPDLNRSKDFIAYATYQLSAFRLGASGYVGRGQLVDTEALRFKQYSKWAANFEASTSLRLIRLGASRLSSELTFTQNMDSGVNYRFAVPTIPTNFGSDVANLNGRALYVRFEQDIRRHFTVGYRYDMYTPNTAINNNARDTHAFLAAWKISPNLRLMNELGWVIDNVHALNTAPLSKHIVYNSTVLQAGF
jgi:hypothetical protein